MKTGENLALLTDLYQLTMLKAYYARSMRETAVFELFVRRFPAAFLVSAVSGLPLSRPTPNTVDL